jgi:hypothetical protein
MNVDKKPMPKINISTNIIILMIIIMIILMIIFFNVNDNDDHNINNIFPTYINENLNRDCFEIFDKHI